jgi:PST family polysaccharide transporter
MAMFGYGVWALVWGTFVQTVLSAVAQLAAARHSYRPLLAWQELGELLRFGFGAAVSGAANYAALNGDNFIVGRWIGVASLGLYERAYFLMNLPYTCVANVLSGVMFPAFARVQNDPAALRTGYLLVTQITAMIAAPAMATMAVAAPHLVPALYGPRWTGLVVPLQILCAAGYFRALYHLGGIVAQSAGRVYSELWRQALYACFVVGGAVAGMAYGLAGVAIGVGIAILYMFAATGSLALRVTSTTWTHYFRVQLSALLTATVTYVIVVLVRALLVRWALPDGAIAAGILVAAIPSWSLGMLWTLSDPQCAPLRSRLPAWCARLIPLGTADDASAASERGPAISAVP